MNVGNTKRSSTIILIIMLLGSSLVILFTLTNNLSLRTTNNQIGLSRDVFYTEQWLQNSDFDTNDYWNVSIDSNSPLTDVSGEISEGNAKIDVIGEEHELKYFADFTNDTDQSEWEVDTDPKFPLASGGLNASLLYPDDFNMSSNGAYLSHYWENEEADQIAVVNWNHTIKMDYDMSDYNITSASLMATFNATAQASVSEQFYDYNGGDEIIGTGAIDVLSDSNIDSGNFQAQTGDYARFYVIISDTEYITSEEVAYNQTTILGQDDPEINNITDGVLYPESEEELREHLMRVLEHNNRNFTISIGMYVKCEDNFPQDSDFWELLSITSLSLNFTYRKRIDRGTTIQWSQEGDQISGENIVITNGNLKFEYKLNDNWTETSEFSELRFFINGNQFDETIRLSDYEYSDNFIPASQTGFDLTAIPKDQNLTLSIQLYLANTFDLTQNITIFLDNVYLEITYKETFADTNPEPWIATAGLIGAIAAFLSLGGYFAYYYRVLRFPKPVRKVRKYRKSLKKDTFPRGVNTPKRGQSFNQKYQKSVKDIPKRSKKKGIASKFK
jgi:hypothetical protein